MKAITLLLAGICLFSCNSSKEKDSPPAETTTAPVTDKKEDTSSIPPVMPGTETNVDNHGSADPVTDVLMKLSFIIKSDKHIRSITNNKQGISFMQEKEGDIVYVKAGYNGPERFETYHDISYNTRIKEIKVMDIVEGDYIPLSDYLKKNP